MHDAVALMIDRPGFEKRLAAYLTGCGVDELTAFLNRHGVHAASSWPRSQLMAETSEVLRAHADTVARGKAQQMLIGGGNYNVRITLELPALRCSDDV